MSTPRTTALVSVEDFLKDELQSPVKREYVAGAVFAMVGATNAHNLIASNTLVTVGSQLKGRSCRAFNSDTKIRIQMSGPVRFYYPDVSVVCNANPLSDTFQDEPVVIFEVLSESTRRLDDGEKREAYFTIPGLMHYVLLEQDSPAAIVYRRVGQSFVRSEFQTLNDVISLKDLDLTLRLSDLYAGIADVEESV